MPRRSLQRCKRQPSQETPPRRKGLSTTSLLILCNTLIFFAMLVHCAYIMGKAFGDSLIFSDFDSALLQKWGGDYGPLTLTGQFWRIITSTFLHSNLSAPLHEYAVPLGIWQISGSPLYPGTNIGHLSADWRGRLRLQPGLGSHWRIPPALPAQSMARPEC